MLCITSSMRFMITEAQRLAEQNLKTLSENDYPGRGIVLGRFDQDHWGGLYWIMGRSANSRNRCLRYENEISPVPLVDNCNFANVVAVDWSRVMAASSSTMEE